MIEKIVDVIKSFRGDVEEIYEYRTVLKSLLVKDLIGRYESSYLGFLWHFFTPVMMMLVYYIGFTEVRSSSLDNFWIYLASGLFAFTFMVNNLTNASTYVTSAADVVKKMYFPREIVVLAKVLSSFIVMLVGYLIVAFVVAVTGNVVNPVLYLLLPVFFIITFLFATGCALIASSITVYVRDFQYFLASISMGFFFLSPMYFVASNTTGVLQTIVTINPFTYYLELFHDIIYWSALPSATVLVVSVVLSILVFLAGWIVFGILKNGFAERL